MQNEIIQSIAAYLEENLSAYHDGYTETLGWKRFVPGMIPEIARELAAAIAPHLEAGAGWEDAPSWAGWRIEYSDGSHNFSRGYPGIITTGVVKVECRTK